MPNWHLKFVGDAACGSGAATKRRGGISLLVARCLAGSYSQPPFLELKGARMGFPSCSAERRALRIVAESSQIEIRLKPGVHTMNAVFEIEAAPQKLDFVSLNGKTLPPADYAWDGATLWTCASIGTEGATLDLRFQPPARTAHPTSE